MIKCLIIALLIWFLFSQFFFIREGFTDTINQNIRPKIRQLRINKEINSNKDLIYRNNTENLINNLIYTELTTCPRQIGEHMIYLNFSTASPSFSANKSFKCVLILSVTIFLK